MSKSNQSKVVSLLILVLSLMFFFVPLDMQWDEIREKYYPSFVYEYAETLIIHLTFLFCLVLNYVIKSKFVYRVTTFVLFIIAVFYFLFAVMHCDSKSWYAVGFPYLSGFLPLVLYRMYLGRKIKE